ncbi:hypothetical protein GCM10007989_24590 [Devosia pacifica]|uniref:Uncharacterized protein n=1 Tax=Devosia pacifica TaxID=1335967 RepID=A0A918S7Y0_9HYPH|nr:hypothetical protein [Devosia pacifica]GHA27780.1 hypothetical protein GCM10007989_24590 [Devosia pacifica]
MLTEVFDRSVVDAAVAGDSSRRVPEVTAPVHATPISGTASSSAKKMKSSRSRVELAGQTYLSDGNAALKQDDWSEF